MSRKETEKMLVIVGERMAAAKQKYNQNINVKKNVIDNFGMIYDSLLKSEEFKKLPRTQQMFYIICIVHSQSENGRRCLYNHGIEEGKQYDHNNDFVFPASHMTKYGINRSNGCNYLKALCKAGFIEKKEGNKHRFKVSVYSFSSKWKVKKQCVE